jgi:hypothetical protein
MTRRLQPRLDSDVCSAQAHKLFHQAECLFIKPNASVADPVASRFGSSTYRGAPVVIKGKPKQPGTSTAAKYADYQKRDPEIIGICVELAPVLEALGRAAG